MQWLAKHASEHVKHVHGELSFFMLLYRVKLHHLNIHGLTPNPLEANLEEGEGEEEAAPPCGAHTMDSPPCP